MEISDLINYFKIATVIALSIDKTTSNCKNQLTEHKAIVFAGRVHG